MQPGGVMIIVLFGALAVLLIFSRISERKKRKLAEEEGQTGDKLEGDTGSVQIESKEEEKKQA